MLQDLTLDNLHHAYLLTGDTKDLKEKVWEWFESISYGINSNPDFFHLERETLLIDDVRKIKAFSVAKNITEGKKIIVIETQYFSHPSQHALLKTLEEPGENVSIFILTPRKHVVLPTVLSRVVSYSLAGKNGDSYVGSISAPEFLKFSKEKRLKLIEKLLKDHKGDSSKGDLKSEVDSFLCSLESEVYKINNSKNPKPFEKIWFVKKYLHNTGSSVKQLLEYLAVSM